MDKFDKQFDRLYLELMPVVAGFMAGYEVAHGDMLKFTCYSVMSAMFIGERLFRRLDRNCESLEEKL